MGIAKLVVDGGDGKLTLWRVETVSFLFKIVFNQL